MPRNYVQKSGGALQIKLFGQWEETIKVFASLGPKMKKSSVAAQKKLGLEIITRVKGHLKRQDLDWAPLSLDYSRKKQKAGLSSKTLWAYGKYYQSISLWTVRNGAVVLVGVKKGIRTKNTNGKKSKLDVATIATIHEFSNGKKVPKRPLWNPTFREMGGAKGMKEIYIKALIWHLRRNGIPVQKMSGGKLKINGVTRKAI